MGKYDALMQDEPPAPKGGKYAALFADEPEWLTPGAKAPTRTFAPDAVAGLKADLPKWKAALTQQDRPGLAERTVRNVTQGAPLIGPWTDEAAAGLESLVSPRSYRDLVTEQRSRNQMAQEDAPFEAGLVRTAAGLPGGGAILKGAQGAAQVAARLGGMGLVEGAGHSEATDAGDIAKDAVVNAGVNAAVGGGISRLTRGAPGRVDRRVVQNVVRGEEGGATKTTLGKRVSSMAGDDGAADFFGRHPQLKGTLAITAAGSPARAVKAVDATATKIKGQLDPVYEAIQKSQGGFDAADIDSSIRLLTAEAKDAGDMGAVNAIAKWRKSLVDTYGQDGEIIPGTKLSASALRTMRNRVGDVAFAGDPTASPTLRQSASGKIHKALNTAIEAAGQRAGVDVSSLATNNRDMSFALTMKEALADRAAKGAGGRTSLFMNILGASGVGGAVASGNLDAVAMAGLGYAGLKAGMPLARAADYQLAKLVKAAQGGSTAAQLGQLAVEMGLSRAAGEEIAARYSSGGE